MKQETTQLIGKMKFVVISNFKDQAPDIKEKIERLIVREMLNKTVARTLENNTQL